MHSAYSYDGKESLQSLKDLFMQKGITFCCLTEHADELTLEAAQRFVQECRSLSGSQFVFIPGFEVPYKDAHILLIGTEVFMGQNADADLLRAWSQKAALTILAHPVRNKFKVDEGLEEMIDGVEIWNQQYEGKIVPRIRSARLLRNLQQKHQSMQATGGLDFHRKEHYGAPYYTLDVEHLAPEAILRALTEGAYTFGSDSIRVSSLGLWKGSDTSAHAILSALSIAVIVSGKKVNALLARFGLKLPTSLKQAIRSRV